MPMNLAKRKSNGRARERQEPKRRRRAQSISRGDMGPKKEEEEKNKATRKGEGLIREERFGVSRNRAVGGV